MRIREIEAENFKLFTKNFHEVNEIEKSDLIVLMDMEKQVLLILLNFASQEP